MSLLRSFNIGYAGLRAAGNGMDVIGDNIANAGTFGFKSSRAEFQDVLAGTLKGIAGEPQVGAGSRLANIKQMMSQGDIARTERRLHLRRGVAAAALRIPRGSPVQLSRASS